MKELSGPASRHISMPLLPKGNITVPDSYSQRVDISRATHSDEEFASVPYKVQFSDGRVFEGMTDSDGRTARIHGASADSVKIIFGDGEWGLDLDAEHDDDDFNTSTKDDEVEQ